MLGELLHPVRRDHTPWLDRSGPDWVGGFPGLGLIRISPAGGIVIELVDGPAPDRERALRHGWAEPLALARLGHHLAPGATLAEGTRAVLLAGPPEPVAPVALALLGAGWIPLADGLCPLRRDPDGWLAVPRPAPLLAGRTAAAAAWTEGNPVRGGTDAVAVRTPEPGPPVRLGAVLHLRPGGRPAGVTPLAAPDRLRAAAALLAGGVLGQPGPVAARQERQAALAAVPAAEVRPGPEPGGALDPVVVRGWLAAAEAAGPR